MFLEKKALIRFSRENNYTLLIDVLLYTYMYIYIYIHFFGVRMRKSEDRKSEQDVHAFFDQEP